MTTTKTRRANSDINLCRGEHDISKSATKCDRCGAELCDICMSDEHYPADGHNLDSARYWGV